MILYIYEFTVLCTYIFEALIAHNLFSAAFKCKMQKNLYSFILFCGYGVLFVFYSFNSSLLNLCAFIAINILLSIILYEGRLITKIYYTMFFTLVMIATEVIALFILESVFKIELDKALTQETIIIMAIISKSLLFLLVKLFCNIVTENTNKIPTDKFAALMLISITIVTVLHVLASITLNIKIDKIKSIGSLFSAIGLMFSIMLIFNMFEKSIKEQIDIKEYALLKQKSEMEHKHYEILKENLENVKIIEHDIKKHMRLINEYAKQDNNREILKYLESINDNILNVHKPISNNKALDIVLNEKIQIAQNKNINFEFHTQKSYFDFIDDVDICSIFSNILDNAIESCEKSYDKDIMLDIFMVNDKFLTIELTNSCDSIPVVKNGLLITQKENSYNHGYGMKSVLRTVNKYDGQLMYFYNQEEAKFITNISIPVEIIDRF